MNPNACALNMAYYFIYGASLLLYRFKRELHNCGIDPNGTSLIRVNDAKKKIEGAIKILDTFDQDFIRASGGNSKKFDAYVSVVNELIALCLAYYGHSYISPKSCGEVFRLIQGQGEPAESLDALSDEYLRKALECLKDSENENTTRI